MGFLIANTQKLVEFYERSARLATLPYDRELALYGREMAIERAGTLQFFPEQTAQVTYWTALPALPAVCESTVQEVYTAYLLCDCPQTEFGKVPHCEHWERARTLSALLT